MKRNLELTVKLVLIGVLVVLFGLILYKLDTAEVETDRQLKSLSGANYDLKILEQPVLQNSPATTPPPASTPKPTPSKPKHNKTSSINHYKVWEKEYFYATNIFKYFTQRGFTKEVTSAILGNMMIETSGGSLSLKPTIYSKSGNYYGLCQWSLKYYPEAHGLSFEQQLDYLLRTMPKEFNTFGWLYKKGFDFEDFIKMTDVEEAAFAFAKVYERCGPASYNLRQQAARKAYNYFKAP